MKLIHWLTTVEEYKAGGVPVWEYLGVGLGEMGLYAVGNDTRPLADRWRTFSRFKRVRGRRVDVYYISGAPGVLAVRPEIRERLEPILGTAAEFLRMRSPKGEVFFALHPLQLVRLSPRCKVSINAVTRHLSWVHDYVFNPRDLAGADCFRVWHPDEQRLHNWSGHFNVLVSDRVRQEMGQLGLRGLTFSCVYGPGHVPKPPRAPGTTWY